MNQTQCYGGCLCPGPKEWEWDSASGELFRHPFNRALVVAIREGLRRSAIPEGVVELVEDTDYDVVKEMLTMNRIYRPYYS